MRSKPVLTEDEQHLHRVIIAQGDLAEAIEFIDAAAAIENPLDVARRALVCAALISYARPFLHNEHPNRNKRPPAAAASLIELSKEELAEIISDPDRREQHASMIRVRNKIVAHAESEYFAVPPAGAEFISRALRTYPDPDPFVMKANAAALRSYLGLRALELTERIAAAANPGAGGSPTGSGSGR